MNTNTQYVMRVMSDNSLVFKEVDEFEHTNPTVRKVQGKCFSFSEIILGVFLFFFPTSSVACLVACGKKVKNSFEFNSLLNFERDTDFQQTP